MRAEKHLVRIFVAGSAAVLALILVACGGSGTTTTGAAPAGGSASTTTTTVTRTTPATTTAATSSTSATATSSGPSPCRAAGLALSFLGQQGATGHGELGFALRNSGSASCATIGYPGVQFLDRSGNALPTSPTHATRDLFGVSPLRALVLGPGQTASFRLVVTHGSGSRAGCTTAYALQVIPPNDTATLRAVIPEGAAECGTVTVSPLRGGESAYP